MKKAVVGHGRAEKFQVQKMVRALLALSFDPLEDEADALAVAVCHAHRAAAALWAAPPEEPRSTEGANEPRRSQSSAAPLPDGSVLPAAELAAALAKARRGSRARRGGPR